MIKELILAIILGCLLGFGITGGYIAIKKNKPTTQVTTISPTPSTFTNQNTTPAPSPTISDNKSTHQISLDSPENESVSATSQITLKGSTTPQSTLVITTSSNTYLASADNAGNFSVNVEIDSGPNNIQIDAFDPQDNQTTISILVTYSTAKF
jgi:hypothetical protein